MEAAYWGLLDELKPGDEYHIINTSLDTPPEFREFLQKFHAVRGEKGITLKVIMSEALRGSVGKDREQEKHTFAKYIPSGLAGPQGIIIAKDKILTIVWGKQPVVFLLKNKEYANSMRMFFNYLWNEETRTYRGIEQFKDMLDDTLGCKEVLFIGGGGYVYDRMPKDYVKKYCAKAEKTGLIWRNIARPSMRGHPVAKFSFARTRYLREPLENPTVIWIWGDKVANVIWAKEPVAFVFENKETAQNYKKYFEMMWGNAEE
ncbi:MAG: hypothetical protein ABIF01_00875, partial [Candidatus Micrarchaeota archaeon]